MDAGLLLGLHGLHVACAAAVLAGVDEHGENGAHVLGAWEALLAALVVVCQGSPSPVEKLSQTWISIRQPSRW